MQDRLDELESRRAQAIHAGSERSVARQHDKGKLLARERIDYLPATPALQARIKPIYEEMDGWSETTYGARSWADLPGAAIKYIRRIEELIRCPVALVSTSPERDDTILVRDPFAD